MGGETMTHTGIKLRIRPEYEGRQTFKAILFHPMEDGTRRDPRTQARIPANYLEHVAVSIDTRLCFEAALSAEISRNPFIAFTLARPVMEGQILRVSVVDNHGRERIFEQSIRFDENATFFYNEPEKDTTVPRLAPRTGPNCPSASR